MQTDTPAYQAGVEVGDLIVGVDGESVGQVGELRRLLRERDGQTFGLEVIREGRPLSLGVSLPKREVEEIEPGNFEWKQQHPEAAPAGHRT